MTPDWLLERYALNEATPQERKRAEEDPQLAQKVAALHKDNAQILALHPRLRAAPAKRGWTFWLFPLAAACMVTFAVAHEDIRAKGGHAALTIYRATAQGPEQLSDHANAERGDRLQIEYAAGTARFGAIFSIDGRRHVTRHWPDTDEAAPLAAHALLPFAYELDDAPGFERFVFVYSQKPFALENIEHSLTLEGAEEIPPHVSETTFTVQKP